MYCTSWRTDVYALPFQAANIGLATTLRFDSWVVSLRAAHLHKTVFLTSREPGRELRAHKVGFARRTCTIGHNGYILPSWPPTSRGLYLQLWLPRPLPVPLRPPRPRRRLNWMAALHVSPHAESRTLTAARLAACDVLVPVVVVYIDAELEVRPRLVPVHNDNAHSPLHTTNFHPFLTNPLLGKTFAV